MGAHFFQSTQLLSTSLTRVWDFFADPRNLAKITPPSLDFSVLSDLPERMYPGLMIDFRVRPLFGIPVRWLTEITHIDEGKFFVDEQRVGPYRVWHHEHHFRDLGDGQVEMRDLVTYVPPFGILGEIVHPFLIGPAVRKIFAHRTKAIAALFS